jgi:hypothetical protein
MIIIDHPRLKAACVILGVCIWTWMMIFTAIALIAKVTQ